MPTEVTLESAPGRLEELDVLRGFAVFGILIANMAQYFLPDLLSDSPISIRGDTGSDVASWILVHALVDNKFLTLFSLLFGVSFALLGRKIAARNGGKGILSRRLSALFVFGLIHGVFFYYADILTGYALAALLLWPMLAMRPRKQFIIGMLLLAVVVGPWRYLISGPEPDAALLPALQSAAKIELSAALERDPKVRDGEPADLSVSFTDTEIATAWEEIQAYRIGPVSVSLPERLEHLVSILIVVIAYILWRSLALFLIGAALYRSGWLTQNTASDWRRLTLWLLPLGVIVNLCISVLLYRDYASPGQFTSTLAVADELAALLLALAYASLIFWIVKSSILRWFTLRVACVGRTALSNYIGQSAVMAVVATHYGLSLFGQLSRAGMIGLAALFFVVQVAASRWWMRRFQFGPLEWVWRCVSYWTMLPLRSIRTSPPATADTGS